MEGTASKQPCTCTNKPGKSSKVALQGSGREKSFYFLVLFSVEFLRVGQYGARCLRPGRTRVFLEPGRSTTHSGGARLGCDFRADTMCDLGLTRQAEPGEAEGRGGTQPLCAGEGQA